MCTDIVLRHALALNILYSKIVLRFRETLISRKAIPFCRPGSAQFIMRWRQRPAASPRCRILLQALLTHRALALDGDEEPLFGPRMQDVRPGYGWLRKPGSSCVRRAHQRQLLACRLRRFCDHRTAMTVGRSDNARGHVVAKERNPLVP
jgi:hypothetical protein